MIQTFGTLDWLAVGVYALLTVGIAAWAARRHRDHDSSADYFLAGRGSGWLVVGGSLFASNIGAEHLVGLAGSGAKGGVAVAQFELIAGFALLALGWVFVPFYLRSGVFTMPEFLERRYASGPRTYLAVVSIAGYVLTKISVTLTAGGIVFEALVGIDFWTGAMALVLLTGAYTVVGGFAAVLYTDLMQMFVLLGGAVVVTVAGLDAVGGVDGLRQGVDPGFFDLWQPLSHPEFPWTGILLGAPILGVWYWCTDQFIVQRVLAARNQSQARRGAIFAGLLKVLPLFVFVIPGIMAHVLAKSGRLALDEADHALPALVTALLPEGLRGVVVAGLLAALMSSLSSAFNSCATLVSVDVYKRLRPDASERAQVLVGQGAVVALVGLSLLWIPFMHTISGQLYAYLQSVQAYISPPIAAVFLFGVLWPRANAKGAMAALLTGLCLGVGRLVLEINEDSLCGIWLSLARINFLHVAVVLFAVCTAVLVGVSLATAPPAATQLKDLTFATVASGAPVESGRVTRQDIALSVLLVALIGGIWAIFSS
ncbi:MAG: sodium:solute symporter [Myxococcales bacterium]|nr:sodium:solute symporter [Myxococcales bacterium]MDD9965099.1 sodium:solute symporter [Myxococcales bacterium]